AVTPKNKDKRVRFTKPVTPSGNTITDNASSLNLFSNKHASSSTGVKSSTRASGSQPSGNTKKAKIQRPPSSTQKNEVEAHPKIVKTSLKNNNRTVEPKGTAFVQHSTSSGKSLVITALKDALRHLKGKAFADDAVTSHFIDPKILNVDVEPLNPKLLNNRSAHSDYLKHTQEEAAILKEIVKQGKS
nr:hypothetical protein [Tanacetum cinerariifolium]